MRRRGIGRAEVAELPEEVNPYAREGVRILYKKEYTNPGGSGKDRPASFMLYVYAALGLLDGKVRITTAGAGNFARSLATYVGELAPGVERVEARMGYTAIERNPGLVAELEGLGVAILGLEDSQCPSVPSEDGGPVARGRAITDSWVEEATGGDTVYLDQHGYWKPFDGVLNASAYYHTLGPELLRLGGGLSGGAFDYVQGMGTRGSLLGAAARLLSSDPRIRIVGHTPAGDPRAVDAPTFQFGLRRRGELGRGHALDAAWQLCERVYETPDREAVETYLRLLESGVPAGPSFAGNVHACLTRARELHEAGREGVIATLAFDGPALYKGFLERTLPQFGVDLKGYEALFEEAVSTAERERRGARSASA